MTDGASDPDLARADLCRFLAACYYEPGPEFAEERMFDSMLAAALRGDAALADSVRKLGDSFAAATLDDLKIDYTRLFLGPIEAPARPYGSIWLERDAGLMQATTMAVLDLYREADFEIAQDFLELPDHVAVELEFLYVLSFREAQARAAGDAAGQARFAALKRRLLETHLARWIAPFAEAVEDNAGTGFYRELAALTRAFVASEWGRVGTRAAPH